MDLDAYYSRYTGMGRIKRLSYAAVKASNPATAAQATKLAVTAVVADSNDYTAYQALANAPSRGTGVAYDAATFERLKRTAESAISSLSKEVEIARARAQRDEVRRNLVKLAAAYRHAGDVSNATTALSSAREYAGSTKQLAEINTALLELSLLALGGNEAGSSHGQYGASVLINKLQASPEAETPQLASLLRSASGLLSLSEREYERAAREFLTLPPASRSSSSAIALGDSSVLHVDDAALYGGLAALATFSREDLRAVVLGGSGSGGAAGGYSDDVLATMRSLLAEHAPVLLKDALMSFVTSKYASCLEALNALHAQHLSLDMYIGPHTPALLTSIRKRALKQYLLPYCNVDLNNMAAAFRVPVQALEAEVAELIAGTTTSSAATGAGGPKLEARLHIEGPAGGEGKKLLQSYAPDARSVALQRSLETAKSFACDAQQLLMRASMEMEGAIVGQAMVSTTTASSGSKRGTSSSSSKEDAELLVGVSGSGGFVFADQELMSGAQDEMRKYGAAL